MIRSNIFNNIVFWIILFFLIRMVGITNPPLEMGHSWRQCLTNMVSENMLESGPTLLYPRVDMGGDREGIIAGEFPLFNFLTYLGFKAFGFSHWLGRLINLIISSLGIYYFYLIVRRFFDARLALYSAIILLVSGWFGFSRKIMPDTVGVSFALIALYYSLLYLYDKSKYSYLIFIVFGMLGGLIKMPSMLIFSVLFIPLFDTSVQNNKKLVLSLSGGVVLAGVLLWYFYWVPYLLKEYDYQLYYPRDIIDGINELIMNWFLTLDKFFFAALFSFVAFAFFLFGVVIIFKKKNKKLAYVFILTFVVLLFFMVKTGEVFSKHSYYMIPFTPIMALVAGYGVSRIPSKWAAIILVVISIEAIANQYDDMFIKDERMEYMLFEGIADEFTDPGDKIITSGHLNPMTMYFLNRSGWSLKNETLTNKEEILRIKEKGVEYIFLNTDEFQSELPYKLVKDSGKLKVYLITEN